MCYVVYTPTSCIALRCIYNISDLFKKYRDHFFFLEICEKMEIKILKYWKIISPFFLLAACKDQRVS